MKVNNIMSSNPLTVLPNTQIKYLWQSLFKSHINSIIVVDKANKLLGMVAKDDMLHILYPDYSEFVEDFTSASDFKEMEKRVGGVLKKKASDVMCKKVIFTRPDTLAMRALSRMIVRSVNQLPVVDYDDTVIGIITKGDIFNALFKNEVRKEIPRVHHKTIVKKFKKKKKQNRKK